MHLKTKAFLELLKQLPSGLHPDGHPLPTAEQRSAPCSRSQSRRGSISSTISTPNPHVVAPRSPSMLRNCKSAVVLPVHKASTVLPPEMRKKISTVSISPDTSRLLIQVTEDTTEE